MHANWLSNPDHYACNKTNLSFCCQPHKRDAPWRRRHILAKAGRSAKGYRNMARITLAKRKRLGQTAFDQQTLEVSRSDATGLSGVR